MRELAEHSVLSPDIAEEMAEAARFRNVLAHTYGSVVDDDVVYAALDDLDRYRAFVHAVREYLDSMGAFDGRA